MPQREYPTAPLVGVGAVVVDDQGRVLLIQRGHEPRKGMWSIPGGLLELGESLTEGVRREILEETGLIIEPVALVEVVDRIFHEPIHEAGNSPPRIRYHYVIIDFWCRVLGGKLLAASDAEQVLWAPRNQWADGANVYSLESLTLQVIEKGWRMARAAGVCE